MRPSPLKSRRPGGPGSPGRRGPQASPFPGDGAGSPPDWYRLPAREVLARLGSDASRGLSSSEARRRLERFGPNSLPEHRGPSPLAMFAHQFSDVMVLILLGAAAVSFVLGETVDAIAIAVIILLNAVLGFVQEFRAERALAALRRLAAPRARVVRDGRVQEVGAAEVVPGDILALEAGDRVAADARVVEAAMIEADESALTGESVPVPKTPAAIPDPVPVADRHNMLFQGTVVSRGRGRAVVVATGAGTEMGWIASLMQDGEDASPLQKRLAQLGRYLVAACLAVSATVAAAGIARGEDPYQMLLTAVSLAVAAIPEGLPAVVTIVLALGVQRMMRRNAIVRRLSAVETLGCATVICSDKTGTLTRNEMTVRAIVAGGRRYAVEGDGYGPEGRILSGGIPVAAAGGELHDLLVAGVLCNNASPAPAAPSGRGPLGAAKAALLGGPGRRREAGGDPLEAALLVAAIRGGIDPDQVRRRHPREAEIPFESERQMMTVICRDEGGRRLAFTKGAPERVLGLCRAVRDAGGVRPLTDDERRRIHGAAEELAVQAFRVLALAYRELAGTESGVDRVERDMVFLGLVGLMDPPRPEAREAVERCRQAGLRVVMVTGDHALTARAVATEVGILGERDQVLTGYELDRLSEAELARAVERVAVYARVTPAHKLRIVRALKGRGQVVAMTGDGVNDAPALREADIGVAMGSTGTEVTKEAAAMVLADDNFATIVAAVEEGRAIYANIRKFIGYLLACNAGEVLVMFLATLLQFPLPLLPVQILLVNLVTDGLPAVALGLEPAEPGVMLRPPRDPREGVFARGLWQRIIGRGIIIGVSTLAAFAVHLVVGGDVDRSRTVAMTALSASQLLYAFECRSETAGPARVRRPANPALLLAVMSSLLVLVAVVHVPVLGGLFHAAALSPAEWALAWAFAAGGSAAAFILRRLGAAGR